ncbi:MAG: type II secretion system F family protein [archaeon]
MKLFKKQLERYQNYLHAQKIKVSAIHWILFFFLLALLFGSVFFIFVDKRIGLLFFAVILDLAIGIPIFLYNSHITTIEKYWPDALRLIADTMKAGSSFDYALREVCSADFGPVSYEINEVIRRLEMGSNMNDSLDYLSKRVESKIVKRTVTLIQECLRTGAQLAEVLDEIANDTKMVFRIKQERQTKTMLQTIFIFAAAAVVAPFIFGMTSVITGFLADTATNAGIGNAEALAVSATTQKQLGLLLDIYILIEVLAASAMISVMRDGKLESMYIYFPIMLTVAYVIYMIAQFALKTMLAGTV